MYRTEIVLDKFEFGAKPNGGGNSNNPNNFNNNTQKPVEQKQENQIEYPEEEINPEDIPF